MHIRFHNLLPVCLAACAAGRPDLYRPGEPTKEQLAQLQVAEKSYREDQPGFAAERDALARDPVTACWLTRLFVREILQAREGRDLGADKALLAAAAGKDHPAEARALAQIDALGAAAVPCLVEDLARHRQTVVRLLGIELLARIGEPALPGLQPLLRSDAAVERRTAAQVLGAMPSSAEVTKCLQQCARDADFTVRAAALQGFDQGGAESAALLRAALTADDDPFVRRTAATVLAGHPGPATADAVIDYLQRCKDERDPRGEEAAQATLQALARSRGPRTVAAWRQWATSYDPVPRDAAAGAGRPDARR